MPPAAESSHSRSVGSFLRGLVWLTAVQPWITVCLLAGITVAAAVYSQRHLKFKADRADLISPDAAYHRRWLEYTREFGDTSDLIVVVEGGSRPSIERALDAAHARLVQEPDAFSHVLHKIDPAALRSKGLQYLSPEQLEQLVEQLENFSPILKGRWQRLTLKQIYQGLRFQVNNRLKEDDPDAAAAPLFELAYRLSDSLSAFLQDPSDYRSPWPSLAPDGIHERDAANRVGHFINAQGTMGFLLAHAVETGEKSVDEAAPVVERLRTILVELAPAHPDVSFGLTGIPVLEADEMKSSNSAMRLESLVSYSCVGLMLIFGFRGLKHPLLAMAMLFVGMSWSFAFAALAVGHLNILSVSFVAIVIGLGIDYAILFLSRYLELRGNGSGLMAGLQSTAEEVGPGILTASATTSLAFFCAVFTDFLGVSELGLIAGGGILLCSLATFLVIPPMVAIADRHRAPPVLATPFQAPALRQFTARYPAPLVAASVLLIVVVATAGFRLKYDYNLMNLQSDNLPSVEIQKRLAASSENRLLFAVSIATSREEALERKARFEKLPSVHRVEEAASMFPSAPSEETRLLVQAAGILLARIPDEMPRTEPVDAARVQELMRQLDGVLTSFHSPQAVSAGLALRRAESQIGEMTPEQQLRCLTEYQQALTADLWQRLRGLAAVSDSEPVRLDDLPDGVAPRFVSASGKWLLRIYPEEEIWDIEPLRRFVSEVRSVDPEATGTPLQNFEASQQIRQSYQSVAVYALLASYFVLLIDFLSLRQTLTTLLGPLAAAAALAGCAQIMEYPLQPHLLALGYVLTTLTVLATLDGHVFVNILLALCPPLAGGVLTVGILGLLQVDFNPANLIILPLILGIGVDNGVHVLHDYRRQLHERYRTSPSLMNALFMTSLSNMGGFASLILASHRGLRSIGQVLTIGVASCLFISVVLLPGILTLLSQYRHRHDPPESLDEPLRRLDPPVDTEFPIDLHVFYPDHAA